MRAQLARDLKLAWRTGGGLGHALGFFLIFGILMVLSNRPEIDHILASAIGLIWFGLLFASLLNLDFAFRQDYDDGTYERLATSPLPLEMVLFAKVLLHYLTTCLPLALLAPLMGLALDLSLTSCGYLLLSLVIGTLAISAIGGLGAILSAGIRRSALLQSLLCLPLCIPTLIFGAAAVPITDLTERNGLALIMVACISLASLAVVPLAAAYALRALLADD